jgi:hypothetical protein
LDNIAIYVSPQGGVDDTYFSAGITAAKDKSGVANLDDALPPLWKGKYQGHFFTFDHTLAMGAEAAGQGVTHLALLEGPMGGFGEFFFDGDTITHNAVVLYYVEDTHEYRYMHCRDCAVQILKWMTEQQGAWSEKPNPAALVA